MSGCLVISQLCSGTDCVQVAFLTARRLNAHISSVAVQFETQFMLDVLLTAVATCRPGAAPSRIGVKVLNSAPSSAYCSPLGGLDHVTDALEQGLFKTDTRLLLYATTRYI